MPPRSEVIGWLGEALKVKIHAPPVEGAANKVLCSFLAESLNVPKRSVKLARGETSRRKIVEIEGLSREEIELRLFSQT